ncbi:uncharacterized protein METZ01_LOCUS120064 [marine metagenome]|uniref:Uncharacterized protein n=1 Tax=marine metagenome TaxID=408172 RepID=A0A381XRE2_9ZZZZ
MSSSKRLKRNPAAKELRTNKFRSQKIPNKKKQLEKKRIKINNKIDEI